MKIRKLYDPVTLAVRAAKEANAKEAKKSKKPAVRHFTWAHNVDGCLQNGSFVRQYPSGVIVQYMNGDNMGPIDAVPDGMTEVGFSKAINLMPSCCK